MAIDRDEVAKMIIDSLSTLETYRRSVIDSKLYARERREEPEKLVAQTETLSFDPVMQLLRLQLAQLRPVEREWTSSKRIIITTDESSAVIQVTLNWNLGFHPALGREAVFEFPPNEPRFLEEFRRAQNHALVVTTVAQRTNDGLMLEYLAVGSAETPKG